MNISEITTTIYYVIKGTPIYVWILFAYLISRGLSATMVKEFSIQKMLLMPVIFTCWGLDKMFLHFSNLGLDLFFYLIFLCAGAGLGYILYGKRKVFYRNNAYYRTGSYLPLVIILINFTIKYVLSVLVAIQPALYQTMQFCMIYSILSGLSVGLFFGGLLQIYVAKKDCDSQMSHKQHSTV